MKSSMTRKERRKIQQRMTLSGNIKKGAAVVGTVTAVTAITPLLPVHSVHAEEADSNVVAPYDATEDANNVETQGEETTTEGANNSETEANNSYSEDIEQQQSPASEDETSYVQEQDPSQETGESEQWQEQQEAEETPVEEAEEDPAEVEAQGAEEETEEETEEVEELELPEDEDEQLQEEAEQHPGDNNGPAVSTFSSVAPEPSAFIEGLAGHAAPVAEANNLYASVMIAQAVVESGWGSSTLSQAPNNNLFGIKGTYNGQSVKMPTQEYINGRYVTVNADFRKYPSYTASFQDNAALLSTNLYSGAWKSNTNSYKDATAALTGLYATAPNYNTVLNGVIEDYNLTRFDTGNSDGVIDTGTGDNGNSSEDDNAGNEDNSNNNDNSSSNSGSDTYTVKAGDSVWLIANNNGISMDQLRSWNNIQNDFVYPGQELTVSQGNSSNGSNDSNNNGDSNDNSDSSSNGSDTYTVKSGDSVWLIANNNGISMDQLRSWNNIQNDFVYPGQELTVSQGNSSSGSNNSNNSNSSNSNSNSGGSYTVKSGDSVWLIANNNGISMDQLRSWNNIQNDFVYPGQELTVSQG
ncbi:MAG: LysM peptidoglycan-binding domain-containing protein, partial [Staphylococcus equorum]|nr:LysM peptidoglycan-binding domain-containing protein [Staphylococcus equorum]